VAAAFEVEWLELPAGDRARRRATIRETVRTRLGERLGVPPGEIELRRAPAGKPEAWLAGAPAPVRFNVSHSGEWAMIGFADGREIGVDVQRPPDRALPEAFLAGLLAPREREALEAMARDRREAAVVRLWTRKEAYLKGTGRGLFGSDPAGVDALSVPGRVIVAGADAGFSVVDVAAPMRDWPATAAVQSTPA
jgi:4'-phosphopantetheinyl transferase